MLTGKEIIGIETVDIRDVFNIGKDVADVGQDVLDNLISIEQNVLLIILVVLATLGMLFTYMQWKGVKKAQTNFESLRNQKEQKNIGLYTSNPIHKEAYPHDEIDVRISSREAKIEYGKLEKLLMDIEKKDRQLKMKANTERVCKARKKTTSRHREERHRTPKE